MNFLPYVKTLKLSAYYLQGKIFFLNIKTSFLIFSTFKNSEIRALRSILHLLIRNGFSHFKLLILYSQHSEFNTINSKAKHLIFEKL